jgi:hypothetical protein
MREIGAESGIGSEGAVRIAFRRRFDLDHARAEIGEQRRRVRPGDLRSAFNDGDAGERVDTHEIFPA